MAFRSRFRRHYSHWRSRSCRLPGLYRSISRRRCFPRSISIVWLKERATVARWSALLIGFLGVLIVTNPGRNSFTLGALFALGNAVLYGSVTVAVRRMTKTELANTLMIWQLTIIAFFHSFLLLFGVRWPTLIDGLMMFGMGFLNAVGQYFWT